LFRGHLPRLRDSAGIARRTRNGLIAIQSDEDDHSSDHLKCIHDLRVVRTPEASFRTFVDRDPRRWGIAFFEYCFQVPANRWGYGEFSASQLKIIQEVITLSAFAVFSVM